MKIAKKLYFDIPGLGRLHASSGSFDPGGEKRDAVMTDLGVAGYTEEPVAPTVQFKVPNIAGTDLNQLRNLTSVNVNIQDDNGQSWLVRNAWTSQPPKLSGGEIDMQMTGISADPVS